MPRKHRSLEQRIDDRIDRSHGPDECWPWTGSKDQFGRGYFFFNRRVERAPRVAWTLHHNQPFPSGLHACHSCDNPSCVNPLHIWPGTRSENLRDAEAKGRGVHRSGVAHPNAVLSEDMVREIRARRERGETYTAIARSMGVAPCAVRKAALRETYREVT